MKKYYYKLTDICDFQGGSQPPKNQWINHYKDGYIRMLQIRDFTQNRVDEEFVKITNTTKMCSEEDILIARYGASIGKILTGLEGAYNVAIMKSIPNENILYKKYLYYYFNTQYFQHNIKNVGSRAAQAGFNKSELENMQIYVPSLEIQGKIVEVLDKAQELIDKRKEQIEALDELVKSRFIEMFGDPITNPKKLEQVNLKDISELITKGASPNWQGIEYVEDESQTLFVTSENVREGYIDLSKKKYLMDEFNDKQKRSVLKRGDFLINIVGASIGRAAQFDLDIKANINQAVALVRIKDGLINDKYLSTYLNSPKALSMYESMQVSVARANLSLQNINDLEILLPPMELQNKFADFVKQVDKLKFEMETSLKELEYNFNSLMQKAFKGELSN